MSKTAPTSVPALAEELHLVIAQLVRRLRAAGASHELSWSDLAVMGRLETESLTIAELARLEAVKPQSMGATVRGLENAGFVKRTPHPSDRRQAVLSLTRSGRQVRVNAAQAKRKWLAGAVASQLTPPEQRILRTALKLLQQLVKG